MTKRREERYMIKFDFSKTPGKKRTRFFSPSIEDALVTVITPYYNAGKYFEETFNCVMNQTCLLYTSDAADE